MAVGSKKRTQRVRTQAQLAAALGVCRKTVGNWVKGGLPRHPNGYDVAEARSFAAELRQRGRRAAAETRAGMRAKKRRTRKAKPAKSQPKNGTPENDLDGGYTLSKAARQSDADWRRLRAEHAAFDLELKRGKWVARTAVEAMFAERFTRFKKMLYGMARFLCVDLADQPARVIEARLREAFDDAVTQVYNSPRIPDDFRPGELKRHHEQQRNGHKKGGAEADGNGSG